MSRRKNFSFGVLLILVGSWLMAVQLVPQLKDWYMRVADWPFWVIGPGLIFFVAALLSGVSGLIVPGTIISGIGGILYYQNLTGDWASWSYAWTLIIGFVGIGVFLMHLMDGKFKKAFKEGGDAILTSAIMFLVFGSAMRFFMGQEPFFGQYWPVLIIAWGFWLLIRPAFNLGKSGLKVKLDISDGDETLVETDTLIETEDEFFENEEDAMDLEEELKEFKD